MAYGVGKAGCDRMAADCGHELKEAGVAMISLWPGPVKTEFITEKMKEGEPMFKVFEKGESIEFSGKVVAQLAMESEEKIMARSGRIFNTADVARQYNIKDIDGTVPLDFRQVTNNSPQRKGIIMMTFIGNLTPLWPIKAARASLNGFRTS